MTNRTCPHCAADVTPPPDHAPDRPLTCPTCQTVLTPPDRAWPDRGLPAGMSLKWREGELILTQRSNGWWGYAALFGLVGFMLSYGLLFSDLHPAEFLFNPLTWVMTGLAYFSLSKTLNRTELRLDTHRLQIKHGPLPPWQNRRFAVSEIKQLYVKQRIEGSGKNRSTNYDLYLTPRQGASQAVLKGLDTDEQALFLEQEIERQLGLRDKSVSDDYHPARAYNFEGWEQFAQANHLTYTPGKLLTGYRVTGDYQGYAVELSADPAGLVSAKKTRLTLARPARPAQTGDPAPPLSLEAVMELLPAARPNGWRWADKFKVKGPGTVFIYEQNEVETNPNHLQLILDTLHALSEAFPRIIALGGEAIPHLQAVAASENHPVMALAAYLIREIAPTTDQWRQADSAALLCPRCLTRCADHRATLPFAPDIGYFGCRQCHQSREFWTVKRVVARLDDQAAVEPQQQGDSLTVPWRPGQPLFDFDAVVIGQTSDETVERFAVQVGNDTDPRRQARYQKMGCVIAPNCRLSANSQRILQATFGQVTIEPAATPNPEDILTAPGALDRRAAAEAPEEQARQDGEL